MDRKAGQNVGDQLAVGAFGIAIQEKLVTVLGMEACLKTRSSIVPLGTWGEIRMAHAHAETIECAHSGPVSSGFAVKSLAQPGGTTRTAKPPCSS
jgi:hypothetical protein